MVIESISTVIATLRGIVDIWEKITKNLPDSPQKAELEEKLAEAKKAASLAEVQAASELGYKLCHCTWPPQIMLQTGPRSYYGDYPYKCPKCEDEGPKPDPNPAPTMD